MLNMLKSKDYWLEQSLKAVISMSFSAFASLLLAAIAGLGTIHSLIAGLLLAVGVFSTITFANMQWRKSHPPPKPDEVRGLIKQHAQIIRSCEESHVATFVTITHAALIGCLGRREADRFFDNACRSGTMRMRVAAYLDALAARPDLRYEDEDRE